jgi:hypothetical protein
MGHERSDKVDRIGGPPALVAIVRAARKAGDRELERAARQRLEEEYGIKLTFLRERRETTHA